MKLGQRTAWVAERRGRLVGMIALAAVGDEAELEGFMVEPDILGRGVGQALLATLLDERRLRIKSLGLD